MRARVDLLWNGGIGTYVKASVESNLDAGDPGNDAVRVNGGELRCRVVAEGGNLGFTQRSRVEYALRGGKINTDFIDNSGGVDCSDREVNIKILLEDAIRQKKLPRAQRNKLLAEMTEQIAALVLGNNYAQTQALSMMDSRAAERLGEHARLIRVLEARGLLDRALEFLPSDEQIEERRASRARPHAAGARDHPELLEDRAARAASSRPTFPRIRSSRATSSSTSRTQSPTASSRRSKPTRCAARSSRC